MKLIRCTALFILGRFSVHCFGEVGDQRRRFQGASLLPKTQVFFVAYIMVVI